MRAADTATAAARTDERGGRRRRIGIGGWTVIGLFAVTILMILASRAISPAFGSWQQAKAILILTSFVMVIAFGQQSVILIGGLDLSVGSMMTLGGILTFGWVGASTPALLWGLPAVLLVTGLLGAVNGIGVTLFRVPPFIMTLATWIIIYSAALAAGTVADHGFGGQADARCHHPAFAGDDHGRARYTGHQLLPLQATSRPLSPDEDRTHRSTLSETTIAGRFDLTPGNS